MATRLLRIWRTSKARFCGSALRGAWKGEKGVPAVDRGGAGGGVVIVVSVDTVEARERAERSQLDFIALAFMRSALRAVLLFCSVCIRSISGRLESRSLCGSASYTSKNLGSVNTKFSGSLDTVNYHTSFFWLSTYFLLSRIYFQDRNRNQDTYWQGATILIGGALDLRPS